MTENGWKFSSPDSVCIGDVTMADRTGFDLHTYLPRTGGCKLDILDGPWFPKFSANCCFHKMFCVMKMNIVLVDEFRFYVDCIDIRTTYGWTCLMKNHFPGIVFKDESVGGNQVISGNFLVTGDQGKLGI